MSFYCFGLWTVGPARITEHAPGKHAAEVFCSIGSQSTFDSPLFKKHVNYQWFGHVPSLRRCKLQGVMNNAGTMFLFWWCLVGVMTCVELVACPLQSKWGGWWVKVYRCIQLHRQMDIKGANQILHRRPKLWQRRRERIAETWLLPGYISSAHQTRRKKNRTRTDEGRAAKVQLALFDLSVGRLTFTRWSTCEAEFVKATAVGHLCTCDFVLGTCFFHCVFFAIFILLVSKLLLDKLCQILSTSPDLWN